jgi:GH15 family glucan-1,4-alpha-glucosidase
MDSVLKNKPRNEAAQTSDSAYQPIENYGVIGDLHTVAFVGMNGSIDFMSFPHFDSPTIFAALLDDKKGGRFKISPCMEGFKQKQLYLSDTNILLTRFLSDEGVAEISDFMPTSEFHQNKLIRRLKTVRGEMDYRIICAPKFDYGRGRHKVEKTHDGILFIYEGEPNLTLFLRSSISLKIENGSAVADFKLCAGEKALISFRKNKIKK